jgi:ABC-type Fe3+-hydroxamate transport system substrate-binding protein
MKPLFRAAVMIALCAAAAGCAVTGSTSLTAASATTVPAGAGNAVVAGKSTKAEVIAALGKTTVVHFDSGFEVWVYQLKDSARAGVEAEPRGNSEFVVLFTPAGVVSKTRTRRAPGA